MRRFIVAVAIIAAAASQAKAQFGLPQIVFDPTENANVVKDVLVGVQTYQQITQAYLLARQMATAIKSLPNQYVQTLSAAWARLSPANACTTCAVWVSAATYGGYPGQNYGGAVSTLQSTAPLAALMTPDGRASWNARMANSLYLPDAAARADLDAVSNARLSDPQMQRDVDQCRRDIVNANHTSYVQTHQASGACSMLSAEQATNTNVLLGRLVEDASIRKAREIDAATEIANTEVSHANTVNNTSLQTAGVDQALRSLYQNLVR